jgi:transposase
VLEQAGMAVVMVNGRQTRNLPGRKTDMMDCQWGATLHAHGLLRPGFVPLAHIRKLQDYQQPVGLCVITKPPKGSDN